MNKEFIDGVLQGMLTHLDNEKLDILKSVLEAHLRGKTIVPSEEEKEAPENATVIERFISAKKIEGCSEKSLLYYEKTLATLFESIGKGYRQVTTDDIRCYLATYHEKREVSKVTIDNIRRILSSFFGWLEEEDYIIKSPARRIHKVKSTLIVKNTYTDEDLETMRDSCQNVRDLAIIDILSSTGMRVGELVKLKKADIDFNERECIVLGKGDKQRTVYFDARTKIHLLGYLESRKDDNESLFVSLRKPYKPLQVGGVERLIKKLGATANIKKAHPHKFRRTLATGAIDKGMPIEQVQHLLGHKRIDTTLMYAMVKQANVKASHRKYIG
ncbi:MAG: tyrosine-type recombinase/integrase [Bacilli bacterium]|nr:tyrosine-type recombinase/integrase [Bacilli bacterium]